MTRTDRSVRLGVAEYLARPQLVRSDDGWEAYGAGREFIGYRSPTVTAIVQVDDGVRGVRIWVPTLRSIRGAFSPTEPPELVLARIRAAMQLMGIEVADDLLAIPTTVRAVTSRDDFTRE